MDTNNHPNSYNPESSAVARLPRPESVDSSSVASGATGQQQQQRPVRQSSRSVKARTQFSPPEFKSRTKKVTTYSSSGGGGPVVSSGNFVLGLRDMITDVDRNDPTLMKWAPGGEAFMINPDHPDLPHVLERYFKHRRLPSLQRQLTQYGWRRQKSGRFVGMWYHPKFHRDMDPKAMYAIKRKVRVPIEFQEQEEFLTTAAAAVGGDTGEEDDEFSVQSQSVPHFVQNLYTMLEQNDRTDIVHWTEKGDSFIVDIDNPELPDVLEKFSFPRKFVSFHRQLNSYGWRKMKSAAKHGLFHNPMFYRGMPPSNFNLIRRKDNRIPKEKKANFIQEKTNKKKKKDKKEDKGKEKFKLSKVPPPPAAAVAAETHISQKEGEVATKKKKRKKKRRESSASSDPTRPTKRIKRLTPEQEKVKRRFEEYRRLHNLFEEWTLWNVPANLKVYVTNNHVVTASKESRNQGGGGKDVNDAGHDGFQHLLCEEEIPEWREEDDIREQLRFEGLVIKNMRERQRLEDVWSKWDTKNIQIAKGKVLPSSKFNRPTNKWRKVSVGDRIAVWWGDDDQYYNASVIKQQEGTAYFHLFYEDDGAMEWLDLSREEFKIFEDDESPMLLGPSDPNRMGTSGSTTIELTPRKDNRSLRPDSITLSESHAHLAPFLRYSWRDLGLGSEVGTPAYNEFVSKRDASADPVTPLMILQDVRSLRVRGFPIPSDIELQDGGSINGNSQLSAILRHLQDEVSQDEATSNADTFETSLSAIRRVADHWEVSTVIEDLRRTETQAANLCEREARVLEKCRRRGLV